MKKILFSITFVSAIFAYGQNYDCLKIDNYKLNTIYNSLNNKFKLTVKGSNDDLIKELMNKVGNDVHRQICINKWSENESFGTYMMYENFNKLNKTNISYDEYKTNTMYYEIIKDIYKRFISTLK